MKAYISMLADKVLYGLCTVGDYLVFGGARLLRYRSPEPETLIRAPNFAEGSAHVTHTAAVVAWAEPDDVPRQRHNSLEEDILDISCPTRSYLYWNAFNPENGCFGVNTFQDQSHYDEYRSE